MKGSVLPPAWVSCFQRFSGRVAGRRPAHGIVRVGLRAAELVQHRAHFLDGVGEIIAVAVGVGGAVAQPFLRGAIVRHHDDQRIVAQAHRVERRRQASDLTVGVIEEAGEDFLQARIDLALRIAEIGPGVDAGIARRKLGIGGMTPIFFWRSKVSSRTLSQPWSNLPLYFSMKAFGACSGAWAAPSARYMKKGRPVLACCWSRMSEMA